VAGAEHADCYLASIGYENLLEHSWKIGVGELKILQEMEEPAKSAKGEIS
jgi:hypothetical protein